MSRCCSHAYEGFFGDRVARRDARRLAERAGLAGRIDRRIADLATARDVPAADIVVLNRVVVCCDPDGPRLAGAAAVHARSLLGTTEGLEPRDRHRGLFWDPRSFTR